MSAHHDVLQLFTIDAGGVLDEEAHEKDLINIFHLCHLLDATILGNLFDIVLFALRRPEAEEITSAATAYGQATHRVAQRNEDGCALAVKRGQPTLPHRAEIPPSSA